MQGIVIAEQCHIVNILPPIDITGGAVSDVFSMKHYNHATIIIQIGVSAAAFTKIILEECDDVVPTTHTDIAHYIYKEETAAGDTLGARTAVASTGTTPSANDNIFYVIELDASELSAGFDYVRLELTNGANSVIASAVAILSGARHASDQSPTVLT
ncbi:MAG: hypothetical protein ACM3WV_12445 [Bacillota bacterium]